MMAHITIYRRASTHPTMQYLYAWVIVLALYLLALSELIIYDFSDAIVPWLFIVIPFVFASGFKKTGAAKSILEFDESALKGVVCKLSIFWCVATIVEVVFSGGVPILWLISGSDKTYFDFGIPSVHGLLNAVILATSLAAFMLGRIGNRSFYSISAGLCLWGVVVVSRNLIIVNLLQIAFLALMTSPPLRVKSITFSILACVLLVLGFGWLGDLRSGADSFVALALPSKNYPDFLPSGVLWIYIYIATPFNNFVHQVLTVPPEWNYGLTNAISLLLPTVIRDIFYDSKDFFKGDLISEAFNVSGAFLDIYKDIGYWGVVGLSATAGWLSSKVCRRSDLFGVLAVPVVMQSNSLSIFFNHYFYLPILFQYFVVVFISRRVRCRVV